MGWILIQPATNKEAQHSSPVLKDTGNCLLYLLSLGTWLQSIELAPDTALISNANIIPSLVKTPVADVASEKIAHISGASIFGGSATVQPWKKY